jgi:hypothetical protein
MIKERLGQGRLTVYLISGKKSTASAWCARCDRLKVLSEIKKINEDSSETELLFATWNGTIFLGSVKAIEDQITNLRSKAVKSKNRELADRHEKRVERLLKKLDFVKALQN